GAEALTARKVVGVLIAMGGVALALLSGLSSAPAGAWRGDLLMIGAALCMAFYGVWSKGIIQRAAPLPFTAMAMGVVAICLTTVSWIRGGVQAVAAFGVPQWISIAYLGVFGSAVAFFL